MEFKTFRDRLRNHFESVMSDHDLFTTDIDKDELWNLYLDSFPPGTNPLYRVRREYDCSCCRHFIKQIGGAVYFDDDYNARSVFEFDADSSIFQPVMDALAEYVKSHPVTDRFLSKEKQIGTPRTRYLADDGSVCNYDHYSVTLPRRQLVGSGDTISTAVARTRDTKNVFKRSLSEITMDAVDTILELIRSNTLYKGAEWLNAIEEFRRHKAIYEGLPDEKRDNYCWANAQTVGITIGRIRNHSIGVLLTDVSEGMELDEAVRRYERIVAPANYKRPKAIFTKKMVEDAQKKVVELGFMDSLPRRFARLDDISVNNILFSNKDAGKRIAGGNVFDDMLSEAKTSPKKFSKVEEIDVEKFVTDVLPCAKEVEAYVENRHSPNFVSLIAPVNKESKSMFKWNNGFSWAYAGNMTDSDIRENVKNAGGKVDGVLRFSIQWNDGSEYDGNDVDAHCEERFGTKRHHIYYGMKVSPTGGNLDVDIINPKNGIAAVENITYPSKRSMKPGDYVFYVHCFSCRGGTSGFRAEIEFDGQIYRYDYRKKLRQDEIVDVAVVTMHEDGTFTINEKLNSDVSNKTVWNIKTNSFVPVSVVMNSPNYWDNQSSSGHKHYFFMLKDCVNPEKPNGFYNEFLNPELIPHKRVFEMLGSKMSVADTEDQLSGIGFSSTKRNDLVVKVKGASERIMRINF